MELKNKTIILTGAARIGQDVAKALKQAGVNLVITYLKDSKEAGDFGLPVQVDVSKEKDIVRLIKITQEKFGQIDGLVHMAAIYEKSPWDSLDEQAFDRNMNIIAKSTFLMGKLVGDQMLKNSGDTKGNMIFFSDWSVLTRPYSDYLPYNAAKSAVVGLTKSLAKELAPGVLVNTIAPGPMVRPADLTDQENEEVLAGTLLKRWGGAEEITKGVLYLLQSNFVTGTVLTIDGGRTIA